MKIKFTLNNTEKKFGEPLLSLSGIVFWGAWGLNLVSAGQWWGNGNPADLTYDNSEHIYSLADEMPDGNCVFVQSAAGTQFWPQDSAGAPVRYYYTGK